MAHQTDSLFGRSLDRCLAGGGFVEQFYVAFMAVSPEARELFARVNMNRQAEMLAASLQIIRQAGEGPGTGDEHIDELGQFHSRLGVPPRMYDQWLDCLVQVAATCDPEFSPAVAAAWRGVLSRGIERMKGMHHRQGCPAGEGSPTGPTVTAPTASPQG